MATRTLPAPIQSLYDRPMIQKLWKYCMTSVVGVLIGQSTLYFFASVLEWPGVWANVTAVTIGTIPTYLMSRQWVWQKAGPHRLGAEVIPFWVLTFLGLLLSTLCVYWFEQVWPDEPLVVNLGNFAGFGVLWVAKFVILDKVLFAATHEHPEGPAPFL